MYSVFQFLFGTQSMSTDDNLQYNQHKQESEYVVLARRTRPQSFSSLVGQEVVSSSIEKMLSHHKSLMHFCLQEREEQEKHRVPVF